MALIRLRRAEPGDDLVSRLVAAPRGSGEAPQHDGDPRPDPRTGRLL